MTMMAIFVASEGIKLCVSTFKQPEKTDGPTTYIQAGSIKVRSGYYNMSELVMEVAKNIKWNEEM